MLRKMNYLFSLFTCLLFMVAGSYSVNAQNVSDLKFNEILVSNDSNCVDDYGMHSAWIEIFNQSNNSVNIGGYYLTNDLNNPTKYWIPDGDRSTIIKPESYVIFWADAKPERGIFHLNFNLKNSGNIALFDQNGSKLIDKVEIPQTQKPDVTYGRLNSGSNEWGFLNKSTPGTTNDLSKKSSTVTNNEQIDTSGFKRMVIDVAVVIFALIVVFLIFKSLGKYLAKKRQSTVVVKAEENKLTVTLKEGETNGEVNAAIAMALYLYQNDLHDYENAVLTMQKVSRTYSPWSSKIYTLRKLPR